VTIEDDTDRVSIDLDMDCFSSTHLMWIFLLGAPMFIIYGIGIPLIAFIILKTRDNLESIETKRYFLMLYQGFKPRRFFWEFVNTLRKIIIMFLSIFLARVSLYMKTASIIITLLFFLRVQICLSPYKLEDNNRLERLEMTTGMMTLFGGMIFVEEDSQVEVIDFIIFLFIIFVNFYFIIHWMYDMLITFKNIHR